MDENPAHQPGTPVTPALAPVQSGSPAAVGNDLGQVNQFEPDRTSLNLFADKVPPAPQQNPTVATEPLPHQLSQIKPNQAESNQFADKVRDLARLLHETGADSFHALRSRHPDALNSICNGEPPTPAPFKAFQAF